MADTQSDLDGQPSALTAKLIRSEVGAWPTAVISDVLDRMGLEGQVAEPGIVPLDRGMRVAGRARTARAVEVHTPPARPYSLLLRSIDTLGAADVLVLSVGGRTSSGLFGGLLATAVAARVGAGVVIDGLTRDSEEIRRIGVPTFTRGACPLDSLGRDEVVEIDTVVQVGGVTVNPGDLVIADEDGVVFIPAQYEGDVLARARSKMADEHEMRVALREGMSMSDAFERFGVL